MVEKGSSTMKRKLTSRQNEIVDTALRLVSEGGIGNLTIRHISRQLHLTEAALYAHFTGKREILEALVMRFEGNLEAPDDSLRGWEAVEDFMARRTELVLATPDLARVVFAEELFQSAPEVAQFLRGMMHRHRQELLRHFQEAVDAGEIRGDIPPDTLFRMVVGPLRLLIKQWGLSNVAFDLTEQRLELQDSLRKLLVKP